MPGAVPLFEAQRLDRHPCCYRPRSPPPLHLPPLPPDPSALDGSARAMKRRNRVGAGARGGGLFHECTTNDLRTYGFLCVKLEVLCIRPATHLPARDRAGMIVSTLIYADTYTL